MAKPPTRSKFALVARNIDELGKRLPGADKFLIHFTSRQLDVELTAVSVDTDELAADLAGIIARESRASRSIELTAPDASMWVPFRVVIGADSVLDDRY